MVTLPPPKPRNPETHARLRRAARWQIYLPLGVSVLALLSVMGLTIFVASLPVRSVWGDISLIYLSFFPIIGGVVVLVLLVGVCAGLWYVLRELPGYFKIAQDFMLLVSVRAAEYSRKVASIFITIRAYLTAAQKAADSARSMIPTGRKK